MDHHSYIYIYTRLNSLYAWNTDKSAGWSSWLVEQPECCLQLIQIKTQKGFAVFDDQFSSLITPLPPPPPHLRQKNSQEISQLCWVLSSPTVLSTLKLQAFGHTSEVVEHRLTIQRETVSAQKQRKRSRPSSAWFAGYWISNPKNKFARNLHAKRNRRRVIRALSPGFY